MIIITNCFNMDKEPKTFICGSCGCEFVADNDEYYEKSIYSIVLEEYFDWYVCPCPNCGEKAVIRIGKD